MRRSVSPLLMNWCGRSGPSDFAKKSPGPIANVSAPTCSSPLPLRTRKHSSSSWCQWNFVDRSPGRITSRLTPIRRRPAWSPTRVEMPNVSPPGLVLALARGGLGQRHQERRPRVGAAQQPLGREAVELAESRTRRPAGRAPAPTATAGTTGRRRRTPPPRRPRGRPAGTPPAHRRRRASPRLPPRRRRASSGHGARRARSYVRDVPPSRRIVAGGLTPAPVRLQP